MNDLLIDAVESRAAARSAPAYSSTKMWLRALELTAPIPKHPDRILPRVLEEIASRSPEKPALLSERESFSFGRLAERSNQYSRWALDAGVKKGDTVGLLMTNRPEYLAIWLGISRVGGVVALLNTNLAGPSLAHCVNAASPKHVIVEAELKSQFEGAIPHPRGDAIVWTHGYESRGGREIDDIIADYSGGVLAAVESHDVTIEDRALCIYTSGTTGFPKAANISHGRIMQWTHWFAGMLETRESDRLYNCLPMYHSAGGVLATAAVLISGGSIVIRERFSAREFWEDVVRWDCTLFQYLGELSRYLLQAGPDPFERRHRIRLCCGNGLGRDIWSRFKTRFAIPRIVEFYASTEGNVSLFNVDEKPGAIGRAPGYLAHTRPALIRIDQETEEPTRDARGFCIPCAAGEAGEAIGALHSTSNFGARFEGYTDQEASEQKILRDVFRAGDAWYRTGDLMRQDEQGYFYFVDRIGETFRWKGENVSATEVAEAIRSFPGVQQAVVYGVTVPGQDGRAGMATVAAPGRLDSIALARYFSECLPHYAIPLFVRIRPEIEVTGTFKSIAKPFQQEGYDPSAILDPIWFYSRESGSLIRLNEELYERIKHGRIRL